MAKEASDYNKTHEDEALWTNSMFGGMPTVTINKITTGNHVLVLDKIFGAGAAPASYLLISLLGGFLLFLALGTGVPIAVLGAVAVTFCSYNLQIIQAGHVTKMIAIAYMPWVLAALVYAYRKKPLLGALFFALTVSLHVAANHPQITYYLGFIMLFVVVGLFVKAIKERTVPRFAKTTLLIVAGGMLGLATSANHLLPTYEYTQYSMRGGSELETDQGETPRKGLEVDYATQWSYSGKESLNMLIPNFLGGSSVGALGRDSHTYKKLSEMGYQASTIISHMPLYWGEQPFTAGPMYMGAIMLFLFVLGLLLIRSPLTWALGGVSLLALLLSWGYHLEWFSLLFFKYVPLYNKFRTVSMILVIWQMTVPLLGIYTVWYLLENKLPEGKVRKGLYLATGITAGFCLLLALFPSLAGSFTGPSDVSLPRELIPSLVADRKTLLRADALRSAFLIMGAALIFFPALRKRLKKGWVVALLGVLLLVDYLPAGKRYLNSSHFVTKHHYQNLFEERPADSYILDDPALYYRVLDLTGSTFSDATASYFHKSAGGYNAAKLQRYQDVIDRHLIPEIQSFADKLGQCQTMEEAGELFAYQGSYTLTPVMNLLNTKYVILSPQAIPVTNPHALGNAWVVSDIHTVESTLEELESLSQTDFRTTAVMQNPPAEWLTTVAATAPEQAVTAASGMPPGVPATAAPGIPATDVLGASATDAPGTSAMDAPGTSATDASDVTLVSYSPNTLEYEASMEQDGVVVFSEIFYPKGWKAWIDNVEVPILRSNFITRTLLVPAGNHNIRFTYKPASYTTGVLVSRISSLALLGALLLAVILGVVRTLQKRKGKET
ncbi:MAG: YfhO family protein [Bacteroidales bacterium]|nr:YfhO family protein [Bacteroidales bacterium]